MKQDFTTEGTENTEKNERIVLRNPTLLLSSVLSVPSVVNRFSAFV
jgi:hypothetical protein